MAPCVAPLQDNGSLAELLRKGPIEWRVKLQLALDAAEGMLYLHSREPPVIHRDLKTSNLLVNASFTCKIAGTARRSLVPPLSFAHHDLARLDFGIRTCCRPHVRCLLNANTCVGTHPTQPIYMAPVRCKLVAHSIELSLSLIRVRLCRTIHRRSSSTRDTRRRPTCTRLASCCVRFVGVSSLAMRIPHGCH